MQNYLYKFFLFFSLLLAFATQPAYSQKLKPALKSADSLYAKGQYLRSMVVYRQILESGQEYSPQMLLKMAYMEEALQHFDRSMYYLTLYYNLHPNRAVLRKMEEVAHTQGLTGYEYRDSDFFITQFKKYYMKILELLLSAAVIAVTIMVLRRNQAFFRTPAFKFAFVTYLASVLIYINLITFRKYGISHAGQAALMSGPSAGSKWLATLTPGHRLNITGENDIWYEVNWQNQTAFVRKNNLLLLPE